MSTLVPSKEVQCNGVRVALPGELPLLGTLKNSLLIRHLSSNARSLMSSTS